MHFAGESKSLYDSGFNIVCLSVCTVQLTRDSD